jgi:hypothetical protein
VNETIESALDLDRYNAEVRQAHDDAQQISGTRVAIAELLKDFHFDDGDKLTE